MTLMEKLDLMQSGWYDPVYQIGVCLFLLYNVVSEQYKVQAIRKYTTSTAIISHLIHD